MIYFFYFFIVNSMYYHSWLHMSINKWTSILCDICVYYRVVGLGTSVSPRIGTNKLIVVFHWTTWIALACVFATTRNSTAEHSRLDITIVWVVGVTVRVGNNVYINTVKLVRICTSRILNFISFDIENNSKLTWVVICDMTYSDVTPSTNSDTRPSW